MSSTTGGRLILAVDPGYEQSAWMLFNGSEPCGHDIRPNEAVRLFLAEISDVDGPVLVVERLEGYGMPVGREVMDTIFWSGRFYEAWTGERHLLTRRAVKLHLCGVSRAKDANVRQALIDRFGPGKEKAIGTKKVPGPLYGVKADEWAALALAVTWFDLDKPDLPGEG